MIDAKITLEVQKNGVQRTVYIKEGESAGARRLIITLTNNGKVVGVVGKVVTCYIKTPTATTLVADATSVDEDTNTVVFAIPTLDEGSYFLELVIQDASANQIYSPTFEIIAEKAIYSSADLGELEQNTAYIIVTDDTFYTKDDVDDLLDDYATKATTYTKTETDALLGGKIDLPDDAEDKQVLTYDEATEKWIPADASGGGSEALIIELTATETAGDWTTTTPFADISEAITNGSPILITYETQSWSDTITKYDCVSAVEPHYNMYNELIGWTMIADSGVETHEYATYIKGTSSYPKWPTVRRSNRAILITLDSTPTENSNNGVKSGGVYAALQGKESANNKVNWIASFSTDTQYPSAKCVYDAIKSDITVTGTTATDVLGNISSGINTLNIDFNSTYDLMLAKVTAKQMLTADGYILGSDITASFQTFDDYTDSYLYIPWNIIACGLIKNGWMIDEGRGGAYDDIGSKDAIYIKIGNIYPGASNNMKYSTNWTVQIVIYEDANGDIVFADFEDI